MKKKYKAKKSKAKKNQTLIKKPQSQKTQSQKTQSQKTQSQKNANRQIVKQKYIQYGAETAFERRFHRPSLFWQENASNSKISPNKLYFLPSFIAQKFA